MKKTLFKLILLCFVLGVVAVAVFVTERVMAAMGMPRQGVSRHIVMREQPPLFKGADILNGKTIKIEVDDDGFLMPSKVHAKADYDIIFIGGSTTFCKAVTDLKRWPYLTGRILEEMTGKTFNTYNNGVEGSNSAHSLNILFNKIIPMKPDYVVLMHSFNDMIALLYCGDYWNNHPTRSLVKNDSGRSAMINVFKQSLPHLASVAENIRNYIRKKFTGMGDEFSAVRGEKLTYDPKFMLERFSNNLRLFVDMCRIYGIKPVLMTQPNRVTEAPAPEIRAQTEQALAGTGITYEDYQKLYASFNKAIIDVGLEKKVAVIDLAAMIKPVAENYFDHIHYTDAGSVAVAQAVAAYFAGTLLPVNNNGNK